MNSASSQDLQAINCLRFLAVDMVEAAGCGHPGAPMGQAPMAHVLWSRYLRVDPAAPEWPNRDRFVLSCGHASALLYGLLHLAGFDLPLDQLRRFRQWGSLTPGHPEVGETPGVETTTGPLGQGLATAVGMAIAQRLLAQRFGDEQGTLFDYRTWVLASDGDLMEGVASEACSLAGHLALGQLNVLYDDNHITIDGDTSLSFTEDVAARFDAYGWHTVAVENGADLNDIAAALEQAAADPRPSLIRVRTVIGHGSPNRQGTSKAHGEALGADEARLAKEALGWPLEPAFHVPAEAVEAFAGLRERGAAAQAAWQQRRLALARAQPERAAELERRLQQRAPDLAGLLPVFAVEDGPIATRKASGKVLHALSAAAPELVGGSADLAGSNNTTVAGEKFFDAVESGRNFHFGVREHAMAAAMNGMALSGMLRPYGGTFLIFSDYLRPALRLAALMRQPVLYIFTHDSVLLGEDGPTHQPISQIAALRAIPNLVVLRPGDANEVAGAWAVALERNEGPSALLLTRQSIPVLAETAAPGGVERVARGAYVLRDGGESPEAIVLASGSEVHLAVAAQQQLAAHGRSIRVVSFPSWELFEAQPREYRDQVLPPSVTARLAVEAGCSQGWHRWVGDRGEILAVDHFGASAPASVLAQELGLTVENVIARLGALLDRG